MNSKEALEKLGNVEVAVTTIKSGITHFRTLKEQYETEFEILEKELFIIRDIKPFDVHQKQLEQLEKENAKLKKVYKCLQTKHKKQKQNYDEFHRYAESVINDLTISNMEKKNEIEILKQENQELKEAITILKEVSSLNCDKTLETERHFLRLTQEEYELLKSVFEEE